MRTLGFDLSFGNARLGFVGCLACSLGMFRLGTFVNDLSLGNFCLGVFAWELLLKIVRFEFVFSQLSFGVSRLENFT